MKRLIIPILLIITFVCMLCFPSFVFTGARNGLLLWFQIVVPTLLPFIVLSNLLMNTSTMHYITAISAPVLQRIFKVSIPGCFAIVTGFLCGYPMGAKVISDLLKRQEISVIEGQYLLSFCNNASPMFLISFVLIQQFHKTFLILPAVFLSLLAPILCSFLFRQLHHETVAHIIKIKKRASQKKSVVTFFHLLDDSMMNAFEVIVKIGGYIILFSILITLLSEESILPNRILQQPMYQMVLPFLEITNGITLISHSSLQIEFQYIFALSLVSFGGWCSIAQTMSMLEHTPLKINIYIIEKLITMLVTSLLASLYLHIIG
ncbi:MAG: transporter [Lachnospiraceae bacterium]